MWAWSSNAEPQEMAAGRPSTRRSTPSGRSLPVMKSSSIARSKTNWSRSGLVWLASSIAPNASWSGNSRVVEASMVTSSGSARSGTDEGSGSRELIECCTIPNPQCSATSSARGSSSKTPLLSTRSSSIPSTSAACSALPTPAPSCSPSTATRRERQPGGNGASLATPPHPSIRSPSSATTNRLSSAKSGSWNRGSTKPRIRCGERRIARSIISSYRSAGASTTSTGLVFRTMEAKLPFDPIDEAARQWAKHWDGVPQMHAVTSLMRVQQLVLGRLDALLRPLGLTFARYEALVLLTFSSRGALPLGKMGERLQVHPTSVTSIVGRLEADQLDVRRRHPEDGRAVLAEITAEGRALVERATTVLVGADFGLGALEESD